MTVQTVQKMDRKPRTQARRRQETTAALMTATLGLLTETGYAALTMADVAERAGVSRGALNHYYPTKEQLVIAAARHAMEVEMQAIEDASPGRLPLAETAAAFFDASKRFYLARGFVAQIELVFAARHDPRVGDEFFPLIAEYRRLFDTTWRSALARAGMTDTAAGDLVDMTTFMMRGMGLLVAHEARRAAIEERLGTMRSRLKQLFAIGQ